MTIRELFREFVVARRRLQDQANRDIALAWWAVRIYLITMNKKKLPDLQSLMVATTTGTPKQSPDAMRAALEMLSRRYGIPLKQVH